tara:strand:+ start:3494 stop:3871 length:378 start_codon:yes stop_codon:yes gene_type:complete
MDGHFWVNQEGTIIDPYFKSYDFVKRVNNLEGERIYLPASPLIQAVMKKIYIEPKIEIVKKLINSRKLSLTERRPDCCPLNSVLEWFMNGGEIVFGSLGWKIKNSEEIWWEYGGEDYTVANFMRK